METSDSEDIPQSVAIEARPGLSQDNLVTLPNLHLVQETGPRLTLVSSNKHTDINPLLHFKCYTKQKQNNKHK